MTRLRPLKYGLQTESESRVHNTDHKVTTNTLTLYASLLVTAAQGKHLFLGRSRGW